MKIDTTPRLRACSIACSNRRAPNPRRRACGTTETPNSALALRPGWRRPAVGEVRHRDQLEAAVEDAEHLVVLEIEVST
jgi:hypothetical protein